jgi:hypothetical protein
VRTAAAFTLFVVLAPAAWSQAVEAPSQAALDAIRDCAAKAGDESVIPYGLETDCPGLSAALEEVGASDWLSWRQRGLLTRDSLADMVWLIERYRRAPAAAQPIDPASLAQILSDLHEEPPARPPGLMERLRHWLRAWLERQSEGDSWLDRWLREFEVSRGVTLTIVYGLAALVVISALGIVFNELRLEGAFGGHARRRRAAGGVASLAGAEGVPPTLADLEAAPLHERPSLLLRLLVASLVRRGRLTADRSLTHRELVVRARLDDASQRDCLARVSSAAERIVYSGSAPAAAEINRAIEAGRALQLQLDAQP